MFKKGIIADCLGLPFNESMKKCRELGADGVQLYAVSGEMDPDVMTLERLTEYRKIINDCGLNVSALCGDLGGYGFTRREDNLKKIIKSKKIVELALEFGCNIVTTHIGVIPADKKSERYYVMQEACNALGEYAAQNGAYFAIETGPEPAVRLKEFIDGISTKGIAVNLDPANLLMVTGDDPVKAVSTLKDYIVHTHVKDGIMIKKTNPQIIYDFFAEGGIGDLRLTDYFLETPLGEGGVNFDTYFEALKNINYNGYLTVEREVGTNPEYDIALALNYINRKIKVK